MKEGQQFIDQYDTVWELKQKWDSIKETSDWMVWNDKSGWGLWDEGRGLEPKTKQLSKGEENNVHKKHD